MKLTTEKGKGRSRWSVETTGAIDRALAVVIIALVLLLLHLLGFQPDVLRLLATSPR